MRRGSLILLVALLAIGCRDVSDHITLATHPAQHIVIVVMLPAYGTSEQIRAGNMGHVAIEFDGRLHDIGSLNGYAFAFRASTGVRFWPFDNADQAIAVIRNHPDSKGYLDSITRGDLEVTPAQVEMLKKWWAELEAKMAEPGNRLYVWNGIQCASAVVLSLNSAGIAHSASTTPAEVADLMTHRLVNTAGAHAGEPATVTVVQPAGVPMKKPKSPVAILHVPSMLHAGERSILKITGPDGVAADLLWSDGKAYQKWTSALAIKPGQVVPLAEKFDPGRVKAAGVQNVPNFIIGRWYHVESDHVIGQASLGGWYVNGDDGHVVYSTDARVIRFNLFDGDQVVP